MASMAGGPPVRCVRIWGRFRRRVAVRGAATSGGILGVRSRIEFARVGRRFVVACLLTWLAGCGGAVASSLDSTDTTRVDAAEGDVAALTENDAAIVAESDAAVLAESDGAGMDAQPLGDATVSDAAPPEDGTLDVAPTDCASPLQRCGAVCVDVASDPSHCGTCDTICTSGFACIDGTCAPLCPPGLVDCSGGCVDPTTNLQFCGATPGCGAGDVGSSGMACPTGAPCQDGACTPVEGMPCSPGLVGCDGVCIDPTDNIAHCGATAGCGLGDAGWPGEACGPEGICVIGLCEAPDCTALCDGICIDPAVSPTHCGASGNCEGANAGTACAPGAICVDGACQ
jgi:hypothetical protein